LKDTFCSVLSCVVVRTLTLIVEFVNFIRRNSLPASIRRQKVRELCVAIVSFAKFIANSATLRRRFKLMLISSLVADLMIVEDNGTDVMIV